MTLLSRITLRASADLDYTTAFVTFKRCGLNDAVDISGRAPKEAKSRGRLFSCRPVLLQYSE